VKFGTEIDLYSCLKILLNIILNQQLKMATVRIFYFMCNKQAMNKQTCLTSEIVLLRLKRLEINQMWEYKHRI
jgi:hypothetical protein